jgi:Zn-dependent protease with chaperone function
MIAGAAILALLVFTPASRQLAGYVFRLTFVLPDTLQEIAAGAIFVAVLVVGWELMAFAVAVALDRAFIRRRLDRFTGRFGSPVPRPSQPERSAHRLAVGQGEAMVVMLVAAWVVSAIIMSSMYVAPGIWWLCAGIVLALALASMMRLGPSLLPALGEVRPMSRRSLMSPLREIARRSGVAVSDIVEWRIEEDAPATALLAGAGRGRRVFVASHLVRDWSDDEIAVVVAHEIAHHVYGDLWRSLGLDACILSMAFWAAGRGLSAMSAPLGLSVVGDLAALPFIALVAAGVWVAATPLRLAQSRAHERRADRFALRLTGEAQAFGAAVRRLSARHLAEERPSALARIFFYRHPPVAERLEMAEAFTKGRRQTAGDRTSEPAVARRLVS